LFARASLRFLAEHDPDVPLVLILAHCSPVETPDTDRTPYEWQTLASHTAWGSGKAVTMAALDAHEQIFALVERIEGLRRALLYLLRTRKSNAASTPAGSCRSRISSSAAKGVRLELPQF